VLLAATRASDERRAGSVLEHLADTLARLGGALEVLLGADPLCDLCTLFWGNRPLGGPAKLFDYTRIATKVLLATDEDDRKTGAEMHDLGNPLLLYVVERVGGVDGKTDEDHM